MTTQLADKNAVMITIDGKEVSISKGTTVYAAAKLLGIDIPIFCYHDKMPPFGACRVCLVEVDNNPRLQTACTLEATEGMAIKTQSTMAVEGRSAILEFLLLNHPLDCPICDRGGECPLQEHTIAYGPGLSRFFEEKRRFKKPLALGPVLMLDRERCIVCARCTRFGNLLAGDNALELLERNYKTEVGTANGGPIESKFIGNTIMICPVGALTSQVYRFRARPWDNEPTDSTCTLCPVGCSIVLDSRDGQIMRTRSKENKEVNDIWLCDKGWFGYEFTYHPDRLNQPLLRHQGEYIAINWDDAINLIVSKIKEAKAGGKLAAFGGNQLTVEENYYFQKLMRECAGVNHLDHRIGLPILKINEEGIPPGMEISIGNCEELSYIILLGLDLTEEFPVIWLRLRQALHQGATAIFMGHYAPEIALHLSKCILHPPGCELKMIKENRAEWSELIKSGKKGAIFVGRQYLNNPQRVMILSELLNFKNQYQTVSLNVMEGRGNSMGARIAGMRPDLGPCNQCISNPGFNALEVMESASRDGWDFLYVAGSNPAIKFPSTLWEQARSKIKFLVVQDLFLNQTAQDADLILPTLSYVEKGGTFINIEGRIQTLMPGKEVPEGLYSDGEIFAKIAQKFNCNILMDQDFLKKLKEERVQFSRVNNLDLSMKFNGLTNELNGALLATFTQVLFDNGVRIKHDPHVSLLAKEPFARINPDDGFSHGIQDNDLVDLNVNEKSISAKIKLDKKVARGVIVLPLGFDGLKVQDLGVHLINGMSIGIQRV